MCNAEGCCVTLLAAALISAFLAAVFGFDFSEELRA
jgi:hypothetical protein